MSAEKLTAPNQANRELRVDGALGNPESLGDGAVRKPLNAAQGENLATAGRQRLHGGGEKLKFLFMTERFGRVGPLFYNAQLG